MTLSYNNGSCIPKRSYTGVLWKLGLVAPYVIFSKSYIEPFIIVVMFTEREILNRELKM